MPQPPKSTSHRVRQRFRQKQQLWRTAKGLILMLNASYSGRFDESTNSRQHRTGSKQVAAAQMRVHRRLFEESKWYAQERRGSVPTGAQALRTLLKQQEHSTYANRPVHKVVRQVPFLADAIDEPMDNVTV